MVQCNIFLDNLCALHILASSAGASRASGGTDTPTEGGHLSRAWGNTMMQQIDQIQKLGKDNVDAALKSFGVVSKGAQAIAVETADYAKKSFEQSTAVVEKLVGAKTLDKAIEIHTDFLKTAYEGFVAQSTKVGELYASLAKDAFKPYEGLVAINGVATKGAK